MPPGQSALSTSSHSVKKGQDYYNRMLAICYVNAVDPNEPMNERRSVNEEMIERGLAWSFRRDSENYNALEEKTKALKVGIWQALCTQTPWDYRYHTPWSPDWRKVNMQKPVNRWFATEDEAIKEGFAPLTGCRSARGT